MGGGVCKPVFKVFRFSGIMGFDVVNAKEKGWHGTENKFLEGVSFEEPIMKRKTNFDLYLEEQLKDADFAERFNGAGGAWDVAAQLAALRKESGLSQKELAKRVGTSQQQISRLESPSYEGHSLSMLRRVAEVLGATVHVEIEKRKHQTHPMIAEARSVYRAKRKDLPKGKRNSETRNAKLGTRNVYFL
jgi:transcriptional regulator with XRE-family HTH domain